MYKNYCRLRDQYGYKDSDVARATGITKSTFSDWKSGRSNPKNDKLKKIADFFKVSVDELMACEEMSSSEDPHPLTIHDERDIAKDLHTIMEKLKNGEEGPASFEGTDIPEEDLDLFAGQLELMLRRLKALNKEKYNPNKYKE